MIRSSIERDFAAKKEGDSNEGKNPQEASGSRTWSALKDPRIVRVSRSFGGKDRHSKVRTIRGLRDRRIRLSVPTAIQLYDLQERLGLNQPSKAVDWLLNAAQHAIDELPLLQMPAENYVQYSQPMVASHGVATAQAPSTSLLFANSEHLRSSTGSPHALSLLSGKGDAKSRNDVFGTDQTESPKSMYWNSNEHFRAKLKDVGRETMIEKSDWMKRNEQENQQAVEVLSAQRWTHSSLPRANHSFLAGSINSVTPYTSYYHLELPSNASASHSVADGNSSQAEELHNYNTIPLPSSLALPSGSHQLLFYPPGTNPSIIPSYAAPPNDFDPKQIVNFQMLSSSSQNVRPNSIAARATQLSIAPMHYHSYNNHVSQSNGSEKGTDGTSSSTAATTSYLRDPKVAHGSNPPSFM